MKLMISLRYDAAARGHIKCETDYKYESRDTPTINKYGLELLAAFESGVKVEGGAQNAHSGARMPLGARGEEKPSKHTPEGEPPLKSQKIGGYGEPKVSGGCAPCPLCNAAAERGMAKRGTGGEEIIL